MLDNNDNYFFEGNSKTLQILSRHDSLFRMFNWPGLGNVVATSDFFEVCEGLSLTAGAHFSF